MEFIVKVKEAIQDSLEFGLISEEQGVLTGFSGEKLVGMLQRLSQNILDENSCYLEVGVYRGLTLLSVAKEIGERKAFGIDNFAYFDKEGVNHGIVKERIQKLNLTNAHIINKDYEEALENLHESLNLLKVGVYFVDGPHDYRSQLMCLELIKPFLAEKAVIIIDDSNYRHVRQANRDFLISHPEFQLVFQSYTDQHPLNKPENERANYEKGWWNGVNVIIKDADANLETEFPETHRDRTLYENEHIVHGSEHPEIIPFLFKLNKVFAPIIYKFSKLKNRKSIVRGRFKTMNTYSESLPKNLFNSKL